MEEVDLLVVGGGINGAGIARDAADRGLSVMLVEKDDLASHTSSASSKLIHGGLRYLEQYEFRLVRESLAEREILLRAAPHIVEPLEFILPLTSSSRPAWMLRAGLFLYDHLGGARSLPGSSRVRLAGDDRGEGLKSSLQDGFSYWDARVQDSRLVMLNAVDAAERGATILTRTELVSARREGEHWIARIHQPGHERSVRARALVNSAGPWVVDLFERVAGVKPRHRARLVKGSHVVLPRLHSGNHAFILQNPDGRVVFAIPFEGHTLVGTTDVEIAGPLDRPGITGDEIEYLLDTVARNFNAKPSRDEIVSSYAGIRALADDGDSNASYVTRDYVLDLDGSRDEAPLLSVYGGKITTYRRLAEHALDRLTKYLPKAASAWTARAILPGGDRPDLDGYVNELSERYSAVPADLIARLVRTYGTRAERVLEGAETLDDLGHHFGSSLYAREVDYLVAHEWARTAEDILFRRTKLGLQLRPEEVGALTKYLS